METMGFGFSDGMEMRVEKWRVITWVHVTVKEAEKWRVILWAHVVVMEAEKSRGTLMAVERQAGLEVQF